MVAIKATVATYSEPQWRSIHDKWIASAVADLVGAIRVDRRTITKRISAVIRWLASSSSEHECEGIREKPPYSRIDAPLEDIMVISEETVSGEMCMSYSRKM